MRQHKATRIQVRRHNEQLVLRAVYGGLATNRAALATELNLTKPTISDIVAGLIEEGLLVEEGFGQSTESGGKRPRLLRFLTDSRQVIGVSLTTDLITCVLSNLNGNILLEHHTPLHDKAPEEVFALLVKTINGVIAQLTAPLQCISVGIVATVDQETGTVRHAPRFGWRDVPLAHMLNQQFNTPVHIANSTALAALAQLLYTEDELESLATLLINNSIGVGMAYANMQISGNDIGQLVLLPAMNHTPARTVEQLLSWRNVKARASQLVQEVPDSLLNHQELSYLYIQYAQAQGDVVAEKLMDEISNHIAIICAWLIATQRIQRLTIGGAIANLGDAFLARVIQQTRTLTLADTVDRTEFALNPSANLVTIGTIAQALQKELGIL